MQFGIAGLMGVMPVLNRRAKRTVLSTHYYGGKKVEKSHRCADFSIPSLCRSHKLGLVEKNIYKRREEKWNFHIDMHSCFHDQYWNDDRLLDDKRKCRGCI